MSKICQRFVKFCQSGEISPNLVTLLVISISNFSFLLLQFHVASQRDALKLFLSFPDKISLIIISLVLTGIEQTITTLFSSCSNHSVQDGSLSLSSTSSFVAQHGRSMLPKRLGMFSKSSG